MQLRKPKPVITDALRNKLDAFERIREALLDRYPDSTHEQLIELTKVVVAMATVDAINDHAAAISQTMYAAR